MTKVDPDQEKLYMPSNWVVRVPVDQAVPLHIKVLMNILVLIPAVEQGHFLLMDDSMCVRILLHVPGGDGGERPG